MGIDFSKSNTSAAPQPQADNTNEMAVVEQYDIAADRQRLNAELVNSQEVDDLVSKIEVNNLSVLQWY